MKTIRIIPRLDIKGPNLVKGIHLEGLRVLGKPADFAKYYYENGADELMFMDVVASLYERNSLHDIISETAKQKFIPITVGGGLRTISDIKDVLRVGADKVCLNTAVIKDPELIRTASRKFGSSTIVVAIEAIKEENGKYLAYTDNGREYTGIDVFEWAQKVDESGAGEIVITSVDKEGTGQGFDLDLISKLSSLVSIPVIAHGGAGKKQHVVDLIKENTADAVMLSSLFHYQFIKENESKASSKEGNVEFLKQKRNFHTFEPCSISDLKNTLVENKIESFEKSKTHKFLYINHYPNAEVGVQHIVPFIKEVSMHLNGIVSAIVDPNRAAQNDIDKKAIAESYKLTASASKDIAIRMGGGLKNIVDGNVSSGPSFAPTPYTGPDRDSTPLNAFIRVDLDKAEIIGLITIAQAKGDKLKKAALEYTTDGSTWQLLKTFDKDEATLTFDASELDLKAKALRIRNLEPSKKWWAVKEFTVNYPKKKSIRKGFTNTNHKLEVQVSLAKSALIPVKGLKLNPNDYVGIKLDRIKDLKNVKSMISNGKLDLQVSVNAIEWQTAAHDKLAGIDARYIRLINKSDKTLTVDVDQLEVISNEIHPLSLVKAHAKIYKKSKAEQAFDNDFNSTVFFDKGFSTGESIVYDLGQIIDIEDLKYVV